MREPCTLAVVSRHAFDDLPVPAAPERMSSLSKPAIRFVAIHSENVVCFGDEPKDNGTCQERSNRTTTIALSVP